MKITSKSQIPLDTKWELKDFTNLFCSNEMPDYKLDPSFWNQNSHLDDESLLIISGGSRNGNHLVYSLLDGHPELPSIPGEDVVLTNLFWKAFSLGGKMREWVKKVPNIGEELRLMNGAYGDKWIRAMSTSSEDLRELPWSGSTSKNFSAVLEFQATELTINYENYICKLKSNEENFRSSQCIWDLFYYYLDAYKQLSTPNLLGKSPFTAAYFSSGMRREVSALAQGTKTDFKCIVPVREFRSFAKSKIKGLLSDIECLQDAINESWEHWRHKTIDYLLLKQKYPDNIIIVKYEDLVQNTQPTMKALAKELGISWDDCILQPTHNSKPVIGNSSKRLGEEYRGQIYVDSLSGFEDIVAPPEYSQISDHIESVKVCL